MILRDPVHGLISFDDPADRVVVRLMDTREVQRLRRIRALGPASLAFPGAEHSRFAHALGSAHVMKRYLGRVRQLSSDIPARDRIDTETAQVALAAALLHDLGHGPYSHTFEGLAPDQDSHETWTSKLILDPDTEVHRVLMEFDASMPAAVERLIHGQSPIPHLSRAVSGTFDVDRCDYLMRDSHMTGVRYGLLDLDWLLQSLRLHVSDADGPASLAVDGEKGLTAVEGFFLARLYMYRQVYLHKAVRSAEMSIRTLFRRLRELGTVPPGTPPSMARLLAGETPSIGEYLALDDHVLQGMFVAYEEVDDPVLRWLATGIRHRRLFKSIGLRLDVPPDRARARLDEVLARTGTRPAYLGIVDRAQVVMYAEDEALMVSRGDRSQTLLQASQLLRELSAEPFTQYRVLFPAEIRDAVESGLADLS